MGTMESGEAAFVAHSAPSGNFNYPSSYRLGCGRLKELAGICRELGIARPLLVTDERVARLPWFAPMVEGLKSGDLSPRVFDEVHENPTEEDVTQGILAYRAANSDGILLVGGGSPLDVGKCVALLVDNPGSVMDYEDIGENYKRADPARIVPMVAIPTTSGTGSEVGRAAVIVNATSEKKIIFHPKMQPPIVLADPETTFGLPPHLTAFTGVDAFTHCFEAYCSPNYHPMADGIALEGMRLIAEALPRAVAQGDDAEARTQMMMAASMGATAFQKGLGVIHAIAHALGGSHRVHHGMANAILLPYCMVFNRKVIEKKTAHIAACLDLGEASFDSLLDWILGLRQQIGVPHTLAAIEGLADASADKLAQIALRDPSMRGNPRPTTEAQLSALIRSAYNGSLQSSRSN